MKKELDINELRNQITHLIDTAQEREIQLYEMQSLFRNSIKGSSARNWDGLKSKLNGEFNVEKLNKLKNNLNNLVISHIRYDDKLISIFNNIESIEEIKVIFDKYFNDSKNYSEILTDNYAPFSSQKLSDTQTLYQFCLIRETTVRQELNQSDLKDSVLDEYQYIYGVKKIPLGCYDSIICDLENQRIITALDLARVLGRNELNVAQNNFYRQLKSIINNKKLSQYLEEPLDLFPQIQKFYDEPKDNKTNGVIEINFITPAGTAHYEKLRGDSKDLRIATYHEKGVEGVKNEKENGVSLNNDITPYRIGKKYYRDEGDIEIALKSSYIAINSSNGSHLYEAYIYGTRSKEDLAFAVKKLIT
ncbi:hypothetical protein R4670_05955 [Acinetobacter baumannii]|uniref:hypothetical protein n=1 Tax=Acinetobacter baumannii TaxID=470 RepID=UPI00215261B9|nr:hypothetical protein [Acinetobacter baumannii]MCR6569958.1 hypothetical protein [Acinetobacter baumannii]MDV4324058.1 hypothetical protein [Acinetobacter baumannii]MDV4338481.1 hypothetical protein [Acinetobacter baumannii]MDV7618196.1 hypothetical protein [Acinetobacter baumannii]